MGDFRDDPAFLRDEAIRQATLATGAMREADDLRDQLAGAVRTLERIRDHADSAEAAAMLAQAELNRLGAL
jgi:hypothetical protein